MGIYCANGGKPNIAGFILINLISCMIDVSEKKAFQISRYFSTSRRAFSNCFNSIRSVSLYDIMSIEAIIFLVGVLIILSTIPFWFVKLKKQTENNLILVSHLFFLNSSLCFAV